MELFINEVKAIKTGTTVSLNDESVKFVFERDFIVVFKFASDSSNKKPRIQGAIEDGALVLTFYNYDNTMGAANREMIELGTLNEKTILLNYAIFFIGNTEHHTRVIHYSFMEKTNDKKGVAGK